VQPKKLAEALAGVKRALVVEQTHSAQFARYLRAEYELPCRLVSFNRAGPLPLRPADIHDELLRVSRS
jgi:2-oxoglutarate ferredoxin oxidoreductase subunit alpha